MGWIAREGTVTNAAQTLTVILGLNEAKLSQVGISVLAPKANTGQVTLGDATVTTAARRGVVLRETGSVPNAYFFPGPVNTDEIYAVGPGSSETIAVAIHD